MRVLRILPEFANIYAIDRRTPVILNYPGLLGRPAVDYGSDENAKRVANATGASNRSTNPRACWPKSFISGSSASAPEMAGLTPFTAVIRSPIL